ncbi:AAA family ATPase [Jatrophihabitans sp.]|jgi:Flp pilus assembly CpaE family ATPase|uniref:AAA family ATPase n=1 Tax=Jatrophihabitans sp. TaxID=1932789 RepID=UPI002F0D6C80
MTIAVASAADGAPWEASLLAELGRSNGVEGITVVRRCVDLVELLAVAGSGQALAALVDAHVRRLDADAVDRLAASAVAVIGVTAPGAEADVERLRDAGIRFFVPSNAAAAVFTAVIQAAVAERSESGGSPAENAFGDPAFATGSLPPDQRLAGGSGPASGRRAEVGTSTMDSPGEPARTRPGKVIAVWGPTGAPGRTTTATTLADEMARLGQRSLLIDADVYGGVAAAMFGLLDESPGLVAACRQAQSRRLDVEGLASLCWQVSADLRVLTGISRADRWPELRSTALQTVLTVARALADYTVVDLGFALETDEELSFDTLAPRRNGATLAVLEESDLILAVGSADPIGIQRLVRGLGELRAAAFDTPVWIVLNRVRRSAVPGTPEIELNAALQRFVGQSCAALLPYDLLGLDQAAVAGQTLAEAVPASPLRGAVTELAVAICGVPSPRQGRRRK